MATLQLEKWKTEANLIRIKHWFRDGLTDYRSRVSSIFHLYLSAQSGIIAVVGDDIMKFEDYVRNAYAIVMILEIAYRKSAVAVKEVSDMHSIPYDYLASLMMHMKKFGFVGSIRGLRGGYILRGNPDIITVSDVINIMESDSIKYKPNFCARGRGNFVFEENELVDNSDCSKCFTEDVWKNIVENNKGALNLVSITDLANDYKKIKEERKVLQ